MSNWRNNRTEILKFHLKEWDYLSREVKQNFDNNPRKYIAWLVKQYPALHR
jgi:hypothetical protein